ncbi:MAG: riboflavin synthase [Firmicutes bacterium]|nr:riboflavin synthase [Bacillota bacterium]
MFTGLIEAMGQVVHIIPHPDGEGARLLIRAPSLTKAVAVGESVAVNGCCLTVTAAEDDSLAFDAVPQTLARTTLGRLSPGDRVNLERPLRPADRMGGHMVLGHVDGVGQVVAVRTEGNSRRIGIEIPADLLDYLVPQGSVAVDGVSLTVAALTQRGFEVAVIPHTAAVTTLGLVRPGDEVNVEADIIGKYVARLLAPYMGSVPKAAAKEMSTGGERR